MKLNYDGLAAKVQAKLAEEEASKGSKGFVSLYKEILKLKVGKEYTFRIIPYLKDGEDNFTEKTFYRYYQYSWREADGGAWKTVMSPRTIGERCPISEWSGNYRKTATKEEVDKLRNILGYKEGHYINVYVVDDPDNPENNNQVKILNCPKTVWDVIEKAIHGGLDEEWSEMKGEEVKVAPKIFNLGDEGVNLVIKVQESKKRAGMPDYSDTRFTTKKAKLGLSEDEQEAILNKAYDLSKVNKVMDADALALLFKTSFLPKLKQGGDSVVASAEVAEVISKETPVAAPTETADEAPAPKKDKAKDVQNFIDSLGL